MQLRKMYVRAARAYDRHGLGGCVRLGAHNLIYYARLAKAVAAEGSAFDTVYGTETEYVEPLHLHLFVLSGLWKVRETGPNFVVLCPV